MTNPKTKKAIAYCVALVSLTMCLLGWSLSSPVGSSPDEDYHLASIWCGQGNESDNCKINPSDNLTVEVPAALTLAANCFAFHPELSGACDLPPLEVKTTTTRSNQDGGYPKLFYWAMNHFIASDLSTSVLSMRFVNTLIFVSLFGITYWAVNKRIKHALVIGAAITIVPLGIFLIPSINPSSWAITSAVVLWAALLGFFNTEQLNKKLLLGLLSLCALVIGAGARSDSAVYSVMALVIAVVLSWKIFWIRRINIIFSLLFSLIAVLFFFSGHQSQVITPHNSSHGSRGLIDLTLTNLALLPQLWTGIFGTWGLGWLDTAMPGIVSVTCIFIFSGFVFTGLAKLTSAKAISLSILFFAVVSIPLYILVNDRVIVGAGVQPRYILPLLILLATIAVYKPQSSLYSYSKTQISLTIIGLSVANMMALHTNFRRYITGIDTGGVNLNKQMEWWWTSFSFSPMTVWAISAISFAICVSIGLVSTGLSNKDTRNVDFVVSK